ncbi:uncharacterized protein LOC110918968 [Helianthus annuus]|uniref:uncharacterized protein LOC110918968 n=1 Tax=Helianthus annuus TaxID=4232 RepID=UPI000B8F63C7|nr:uncharacterized protein LOC110918968 [Helianthus annuus]
MYGDGTMINQVCLEFQVLKKILSSHNRVQPIRVFDWNNWVPKKVAIVAWRAEMERLPTKCALSNRNINVQNRFCSLCGDFDETSEHLLVACHFAQVIWKNIAYWCKIPLIIAFDIKDLLVLHGFSPGSRKRKKTLYAIILVAIWSIWKMRNEVTFGQAIPNTTKVLDEVKSMAFLWVKNRSKEVTLSWENWSRFSIFS